MSGAGAAATRARAGLAAFGILAVTTLAFAGPVSGTPREMHPSEVRISGLVTEASSGRPLSDIDVIAFDHEGTQVLMQTKTDSSGKYSETLVGSPSDPQGFAQFKVLVGQQAECGYGSIGVWASMWSGNVYRRSLAKTLRVPDGNDFSLNFALRRAATISGRLLDHTGIPTSKASLQVKFADSGEAPCVDQVQPDASGRYVLKGVPPGRFVVDVYSFDERYVREGYVPGLGALADAQEVSVPEAGAASVTDTRMKFGGTLSGIVTGPNGFPVRGVWVRLYGQEFPFETMSGPDNYYKALTSPSGRFVFKRLPVGDYAPAFWPKLSLVLAPEWPVNATSFATATPTALTWGQHAKIDVALDYGGFIDGVLRKSDGSPDGYAWIDPLGQDGQEFPSFSADASGHFRSHPLPPGKYKLRMWCRDGSGACYYPGVTDPEQATLVSVARSRHTFVEFTEP